MYNSTKKEDGTYSKLGFLKRAFDLCNPKCFIRTFFDYRKNKSIPGNCIRHLFSYYVSLVKYGAIVPDYFEYEFWKKSASEKNTYITMSRNKKIKKECNHEPLGIFRNKMLFNETFRDYRNLLTFDFTVHGGVNEFIAFCEKCNGVILAKPLTGFSGLGISKIRIQSKEHAQEVYTELKNSGEFFCEECFNQTGILHEICPASCNTIRIYTLVVNGEAIITSSNVRFGSGDKCVDNIHGGGMCCEVHSDLGVIIGPGRDLSGNVYYEHPVSHVVLPGVVIPQWEEVKSLILKAAMLVPNQRHVAWDIAVSEEKISIIEGNDGGNFDLPQVCSQKGMWPQYREYLKQIRMEKQK